MFSSPLFIQKIRHTFPILRSASSIPHFAFPLQSPFLNCTSFCTPFFVTHTLSLSSYPFAILSTSYSVLVLHSRCSIINPSPIHNVFPSISHSPLSTLCSHMYSTYSVLYTSWDTYHVLLPTFVLLSPCCSVLHPSFYMLCSQCLILHSRCSPLHFPFSSLNTLFSSSIFQSQYLMSHFQGSPSFSILFNLHSVSTVLFCIHHSPTLHASRNVLPSIFHYPPSIL